MNAAVFRERIAASFLPQRVAGILTGLFGVTGLCLAAVGLYGLVSYSVTKRAREIAIRMALGARPLKVQRLAMRDGLALVAVGSTLGGMSALALTRLLASLIFGASATDPLVFLSVMFLVFAVALVATYIPARRATQVDPMVVLRSE